MCSIMVYCDSGAALEDFKKGFDRTISRGPDDSRIVDTGRGLMGFHRLAIMGLTPAGMQPFELDGSYAVCNGELYGFEAQKQALVQLCKHWPVPVTALGDREHAVITAGGVDVREVDPRTMESKLCPGLYFAGEVLDVDARTGGYNLQIAWSTAQAAARAAAGM